MKIESIIQREGGSFIDIDDVTYHFRPDAHGRHVAEVTRQAHIGRFLQIVEGYRLVFDEPAIPMPPTAPKGEGQGGEDTKEPQPDDPSREGSTARASEPLDGANGAGAQDGAGEGAKADGAETGKAPSVDPKGEGQGGKRKKPAENPAG